MKPVRVAIVGKGRVGTSLRRALRAAGVRADYPRGRAQLLEADVLVLAVPDRAVAGLAQELARGSWREGQVVAHTSGVLGLEVLQPLADAGAHVGSLHPLFAVYRRDLPLAGAWAAVDGDARARAVLRRLAKQAGMSPFRAPPRDRALYHLAAVLASNSLAPLLAAGTALMRQAGLDAREAERGVLALMQSGLAACADQGPVEGLTGPVARGDASTVQRHLEALRRKAPELEALYAALNLQAVALARRRRPPPPGLQAIARLLIGRQGGF